MWGTRRGRSGVADRRPVIGYGRRLRRPDEGLRVTETIVADYLIMGAGAAGMAFADSVFTETDATMVIVDRQDRPGGHWNDAYPFVRLHQPVQLATA